ncbi:MAG TPA: hypothetical protein ENI80_07470 [Acidiferrobacteraceae bacterium]|nr:hypothetical protein [Acidiferrobacteraceae bacterium]
MLRRETWVLLFWFSGVTFLSGCFSPIPTAPSANNAQINAAIQNPARVTRQVTEGRLVATFNLDGGRYVNLQINKYKYPINSHGYSWGEYGYGHTMTIGHFSKVLGSGFRKESTIFFKKRIADRGQDTFLLEGTTYRATWHLVSVFYNGRYEVTIDKPK